MSIYFYVYEKTSSIQKYIPIHYYLIHQYLDYSKHIFQKPLISLEFLKMNYLKNIQVVNNNPLMKWKLD